MWTDPAEAVDDVQVELLGRAVELLAADGARRGRGTAGARSRHRSRAALRHCVVALVGPPLARLGPHPVRPVHADPVERLVATHKSCCQS